VTLKLLDEAIRDGDPIRAVIRETGMNQDGKTQTITTPSKAAQESLILSCYNRAGLDPKDTTYVEAHGTGTIAGDTIEVGALGATLGKGRQEDSPLYVGSIKANMGHMESTSGVAALIKVAMMLEKGQIPAQALYENPNPRIDFKGLNIKVWTPPRECRKNQSLTCIGAHGNDRVAG
jgi:acyl transferase domain-containing protein